MDRTNGKLMNTASVLRVLSITFHGSSVKPAQETRKNSRSNTAHDRSK